MAKNCSFAADTAAQGRRSSQDISLYQWQEMLNRCRYYEEADEGVLFFAYLPGHISGEEFSLALSSKNDP